MTVNAYDRDREIYESRIDEEDEEEMDVFANRASSVANIAPTENDTVPSRRSKPLPQPTLQRGIYFLKPYFYIVLMSKQTPPHK